MSSLNLPTPAIGHFRKGSEYFSIYDRVLSRLSYHRQLRELHSAAMPKRHAKILDVGAGTGLISRQCMKDDPSREIHLVDVSSDMLQIAIHKGICPERVHLKDVTLHWDFEDDSFDGIMSNNMLYLFKIETIRKLFVQFNRTLKTGGILSISSMMKTSPRLTSEFLERCARQIQSQSHDDPSKDLVISAFIEANRDLVSKAESTFSCEEMMDLAQQFGFETIQLNQSCYEGAAFFLVFMKIASLEKGSDLIREASIVDMPEVIHHVLSVRGELGTASLCALDADILQLDNYRRRGGAFLILQSSVGEIVGTIGLYPVSEKKAEIRKVYLRKDFRGQGLGKKLMSKILNEAKMRGFSVVDLETASSFPNSERFFSSLGFTKQPHSLHSSGPCDLSFYRVI
jgi:ubiquinone/menaquinone biosynthesis C-methylase UbiE/N-acetylglutamate synthase-like GNAT family acetyltransferase